MVTAAGDSLRSWWISRMAGVVAGRVAMCFATLVQSIVPELVTLSVLGQR